jgi:hypothetical protein
VDSCDNIADIPIDYLPVSGGDGNEANLYFDVFFLVTGLVRGDVSITPPQDPLSVNSKTIVLKLENSRVRVLDETL